MLATQQSPATAGLRCSTETNVRSLGYAGPAQGGDGTHRIGHGYSRDLLRAGGFGREIHVAARAQRRARHVLVVDDATGLAGLVALAGHVVNHDELVPAALPVVFGDRADGVAPGSRLQQVALAGEAPSE